MLLDEIGYHLSTNSIGTIGSTAANGIFKSKLPDSPIAADTCIALFEYGGMNPQQRMSSSTPAFEKPRVQIICRSTDYQTARNKAEDIFTLLNGISNETIKPSSGATGTRYLIVEPQQSPFSIGIDNQDRERIVCNFQVLKSLST